jgi:hypothetical protein
MVWPEKVVEPPPKKFACGTSAMDLRRYEWRIAKEILDLERGHRGEHQRVFIFLV